MKQDCDALGSSLFWINLHIESKGLPNSIGPKFLNNTSLGQGSNNVFMTSGNAYWYCQPYSILGAFTVDLFSNWSVRFGKELCGKDKLEQRFKYL